MSREEFRNPALDSAVDNSGAGAKDTVQPALLHGPLSDNARGQGLCTDDPADRRVEGHGSGPSPAAGRGGPLTKEPEDTSSARTSDRKEEGKEGSDPCGIEGSIIHEAMRGAEGDNRPGNSSLAGNTPSASQYPRNSQSSDPGRGSAALLSPSGSLTRDTALLTDPGSSLLRYAQPLNGLRTGSGGPPTALQEEPGPLAPPHHREAGRNAASSPQAPLRDKASGSRTKRWTQKIKEKFKERAGSLKRSKKEVKEEEGKVSGVRGAWVWLCFAEALCDGRFPGFCSE